MIPQSITKAMEERADKFVFESSKYSGYPEHVKTFMGGVSALYEFLKGMGGEWNEKEVEKSAYAHVEWCVENFLSEATRPDSDTARRFGFIEGRRFQHSLAVAREAVLVAENERLRESLNRIVGMVEVWTDEHGQRKAEEIYASRIAREALGAGARIQSSLEKAVKGEG